MRRPAGGSEIPRLQAIGERLQPWTVAGMAAAGESLWLGDGVELGGCVSIFGGLGSPWLEESGDGLDGVRQ